MSNGRLADVDPSSIIRVPESAFADLPSFPYKPRYDHFLNLRYAFIDEESPTAFYGGEAVHLTDEKLKGKEVHWETYLCFQYV